MRILVVSNLYPPHYIGGYELGCKQVVDALRARNHDVRVLTSTFGVREPQIAGGVYRLLKADFDSTPPDTAADLVKLVNREIANRRAMRRVLSSLQPEVIYVWNARNISISAVSDAQRSGFPVSFFVSDSWLSEWDKDPGYCLRDRHPARLHRRMAWRSVSGALNLTGLIANFPLELSHVQFASHYLKTMAIQSREPVRGADVIHWGVDINRFRFRPSNDGRSRLLYVGQLVKHKGVETAIEALKILRANAAHSSTTLTIVGGPDYGDSIRGIVRRERLEGAIHLAGMLPHERLPEIYQSHDTLIFPSIWEEPFSITLLEAMASGLAVVSTSTGGTPELLSDGVNGLAFPKGSAVECADRINRLIDDGNLYQRLRLNARRTVEQHFDLSSMVDSIERSLINVVSSSKNRTGGLVA